MVVLSNNDGCCIARSPEAKRLGIKMGDPWFKIREQTFAEKIHVFSSNYELYASMSNRVMSCLEEMAPRVEQYSIDESFLDLRGLETAVSYETFGAQLRAQPRNCAVSASTAGTSQYSSRPHPMLLQSLTTVTWRLKSW
ncbi:Hypothetical protein ABZS17I87_02525 [Kosakonia cowanii]